MKKCLCGYSTTFSSNWKRHAKTCNTRRIHQDNIFKMSETISNNEYTIKEQGKRIQHLEKLLDTNTIMLKDKEHEIKLLLKALSTPRSINTNIMNNTIVHVHAYRYEPSHCKPSVGDVRKLLREPWSSVPMFIKMKHFGTNPQTRNIRLSNIRGNTIQVAKSVDGQVKWLHHDRKSFVDELFEENLETLRDDYDAHSIKQWHDWYTRNKLGEYDARETKEWKEQLNRVEIVIMNN